MTRTRTWFKRTRTASGGASAPAPRMQGRGAKDWILWGALGCTLVGTAHAEYTLAVATGVHPWVAVAVPGALDLYVVRALQVRRDVFLAVLAMVLANVSSHLVTAGEIPVDWRLVSAVGALPPLILWRIHSLWYGRTRNRGELLWGEAAPADRIPHPAPAPESEPASAPASETASQVHSSQARPHPDTDAPADAGPDAHPSWDATYLPEEWAAAYGSDAVRAPETDTDAQPDAVHSTPAPGCGHPECTGWDGCIVTDADLPPGFLRVHPSALGKGDAEFVPVLHQYMSECTGCTPPKRPTLRGLQKYASVGQARAQRLMAYAGYPETATETEDGGE